ncbi:hypothetical protein [Methylobacterium pseudosasicola]|uniref:Uncharacterized protein n=1 Tax=Methylobacterium pseudosasicola TaxID=582667 RepID=A0A1I4UJ46_9HYPH|nr:hypothetical protein [Methylobacterium pseudosasicola]SFM88770.1 hypothetical protein SAMN05192568_107120 [Methylobacterium pseudosasicola]
MTTAPPFAVRAKRPHGTVTYNCPTPEWALKKLRDFQSVSYENISVTGPGGQPLVEADLVAMIEGGMQTAPVANRITTAVQS